MGRVVVSASLSEDAAKRLEDYIAATGRRKSEVINSALELIYKRQPAEASTKKQTSIADIAAALKRTS